MGGALQATLAGAALLRIGYVASNTPPPAVVLPWAWLSGLGFALCAGLLLWRRRALAHV